MEATTASTMEHVRMMCVSVRNPMEVHTALLVSDVCVCVCVCVWVWVCMLVGVGLLMIMCSCVYVDLSTFGRMQGLYVCTVYCSMGGPAYSSTRWGMSNSAGLAGFL